MTEIEFGALSYGAANVGNLDRAVTDEQAGAVLDAAWDAGIRYLDTAPHHGLGLSERRLGSFLATKPRNQYTISTKAGRLLRPNPQGAGRLDDEHDFAVPADLVRVWDFSEAGVRRSLEESLERCGLDAIDILYLHDPECHDLTPALRSGIAGLTALRDEGLVSAIGVGSMFLDALLAAVRTDAIDLLMVVARFTLAEQPAMADVVPECRERGVGIVAAAVFSSGLLARAVPAAASRYDYGSVPDEVFTRVGAIAAVCRELGVELPAAALQYPLREPAVRTVVVRTVVVGGATPEQIRPNAERMAAVIPEELWSAIARAGLVAA